MAITRIGYQTAFTPSGTSLVLNKPASTAEGDKLIVWASVYPEYLLTTPTDPFWAGAMSMVQQGNFTNGGNSLCFSAKTAGASEPASYTIGFSIATHACGIVIAYRSDDGWADWSSVVSNEIAKGTTNPYTPAWSMNSANSLASLAVSVGGGSDSGFTFDYAGTPSVVANVSGGTTLGLLVLEEFMGALPASIAQADATVTAGTPTAWVSYGYEFAVPSGGGGGTTNPPIDPPAPGRTTYTVSWSRKGLA